MLTPDLGGFTTDRFEYLLDSTEHPFFKARVDSTVPLPGGVTIAKSIYTSDGTTLIGTITSTDGSTQELIFPTPYSHIKVVDTVTVPAGTLLDNYNNTFQTPGPLPLLGAGAAFGFSRKLRGRIKASRTA